MRQRRLCQVCGGDCEYTPPNLEQDVPGRWHHMGGPYHVQGDHDPVFMDGSGDSP